MKAQSPNDICIRECKPEDADGVASLLHTAAQEFFRATGCAIAPGVGHGARARHETLVAVSLDQPIATLSFRVRGRRAHIFNVAVHRDFRGQGVARKLFGQVERLARQRGMTSFSLQSVKEAGVMDAFIRLGFRVQNMKPEILMHHPRKRALTTVYMVKRLPLSTRKI